MYKCDWIDNFEVQHVIIIMMNLFKPRYLFSNFKKVSDAWKNFISLEYDASVRQEVTQKERKYKNIEIT